LKVLYISPGYYPRIGGVEHVVKSVAGRLVRMGHEVTVLAGELDIVYCKVSISKGPQVKFYGTADPIRKRSHIFAGGELMLFKHGVFKRLLPIPPCTAEGFYLLFKALELGYCAHFCTKLM